MSDERDFVRMAAGRGTTPNDYDVCLYHSNCPDGIGGAYPFWKANRFRLTTERTSDCFVLWGVKYGEKYPADLVRGKRIVIVDFCYSRDEIVEMCAIATSILILDHHDTAKRELEGLEVENLSYVFDMNRSGAQIAWDFCEGRVTTGKPLMMESQHTPKRPWFIEIIADRDLWKWEIPDSKEIGKALYHGGWYTWEKMLDLESSDDPKGDREKFLIEGTTLIALENKEIDYVVGTSVAAEFHGHRVRMATCNPNIRSEVGNRLAVSPDAEFAVIWRYDFATDQWWISLRGAEGCTIPLNKLCETYSGGGHPKACGFAIHGNRSPEWNAADSVTRQKLAHGNLHDYFKVLP